MKVTVDRKIHKQGLTIGLLYIDGVHIGITLERDEVAISAGVYAAYVYRSPKFGFNVIRLEVEDRGAIEMHIGNYGYNTEGCILVGLSYDSACNMIEDSKLAFNILMSNAEYAVASKQEITVEVKGQTHA